MNSNAVIAILILKNIITQDEGQAVVDYLHDKPQSTALRDTINDITPLLTPVQPVSQQPIGPVGPAQQQEEMAARALPQPTPPVEPKTVTDENGHHHLADATEAEDDATDDTTGGDAEPKPETDKPAKTTSVKKSDAKPAKK